MVPACMFPQSAIPLAADQPSPSNFPKSPVAGERRSIDSSAAKRAIRVLLVEDNKPDVHVIGEIIKLCGISIDLVVAADGEQALLMLQAPVDEMQPSLILLDWNLPKISGAEIWLTSGPANDCTTFQ